MIQRLDICAVVVTHFPKPETAENIAALAPQVAKILIVDNGSPAASLEAIEAAAQRYGAKVVRLGSNLGIAAALNVGLEFAREQGYRWLATFDQDSRATPAMVEEMNALLRIYPYPQRVAVVTPVHIDRHLGISYAERPCLASGENWRVLPSVMTSGNLVNVQLALAAGGFDASLFIDYVDHEFCLRLRRHGYQIVEASRARLTHSLGETQVHTFLWKRLRVSNHSSLRRYYMNRNRIIVWRQNWKFDPVWVLRDVRNFLYDSVYIILWERQTATKLRMVARGLFDGIRNVRGAFDRGH